MGYEIKKGDKFLCLADYIMDDDSIAYTKGKIYHSAMDDNITDNGLDVKHLMDLQLDFFEYFKKL